MSDKQLNTYEENLNDNFLIEAGAGTGKTYSIQVLYLRKLLSGVPVDKILVVTFTNLATSELRSRLRTILQNAVAIADGKEASLSEKDLKQLEPLKESIKANIANLRNALRDFDQAPISTIHGFCSRMLRENAFESNQLYGAKLKPNTNDIIRKATVEFWRSQVYLADDKRLKCLAISELSTGKLIPVLKKILSKREELKEIDGNEQERLENIQEQLEDEINSCLEEIKNFDTNQLKDLEDALRANVWCSPAILEKNKELIDTLPDLFYKSMKAKINGKTVLDEATDFVKIKYIPQAKNHAHLQRMFEIHNAMHKAVADYKENLLKLAAKDVKKEIEEAKAREGFITYDDMIFMLKSGLEDPIAGPQLLEAIKKQYACAFVDEFQDTDPAQYEIFRKIFRGDGEHNLYLIGDPKQSIYKFRNADIISYLNAAGSGVAKKSLDTNYRSSAEYIAAMNDYFKRDMFNVSAIEEGNIEFKKIETPKDSEVFRWHPEGEKNCAFPLLSAYGDNVSNVHERLAHEIKHLVEVAKPNYTKGGVEKPISYDDIAILISKNYEARGIASELKALGIPYVFKGETNVFSTDEARYLSCLLDALEDVGNQAKAALLLATPFFNFTAAQLKCILENYLQDFQAKLKELSDAWTDKSFLRMFRLFVESPLNAFFSISDEDEVLFAGVDTNETAAVRFAMTSGDLTRTAAVINQLGDVLHHMAIEERLGQSGLSEFLKRQVKKNAPKNNFAYGQNDDDDDETDDDDYKDLYELRLPSENDAVKILTIHKSKGLEFKVVFVPEFKAPSKNLDKHIGGVFHGPDGSRNLFLNELADEIESCYQESLEEHARLLYVAITRAKFLCRFISSPEFTKKTSSKKTNQAEETEQGKTPVMITQGDFFDLGADEKVVLPESDGAPEGYELHAKSTAGIEPRKGWLTTSFSYLHSAGKKQDMAIPAIEDNVAGSKDLDQLETESDEQEDAKQPDPIFQFPAGAKTGTCWHEIMEKLDFQIEPEEIRSFCESLLDRYSMLKPEDTREAKLDAFVDVIKNILNKQLSGGFALNEVTKDKRLAELNFTYELNNGFKTELFKDELEKFLNSIGGELPENWNRDYDAKNHWNMTGSIDLLFQGPNDKYYIIDWKSNRLDNDPSSFDEAGMLAEMNNHFYHLQYLIYMVAFLQFYRYLNPGTTLEDAYATFGGVYYVFMRGVNEDNSNGFYSPKQLPDFTLVENLCENIGLKQESK